MDVTAVIRVTLKNWCDPEDLVASGKTLEEITEGMLCDEAISFADDDWELVSAKFVTTEPVQVQYQLPETMPTGRGDWHV